ncbi:hypothetical protein H8F21_14295 [Pseudomonas sp. P66]|uniref:Uncharacterized protein n=1 Tax=Pseudomonas arcuscaelestis TaxID=2710591 RepID=A0ABS2C112_9PSED|nr:hypothetical protein [Pseudomonas arcuscaelestis]MBM5458734.1 hypothetical protein [Pseudomonas arcuscaelestis]
MTTKSSTFRPEIGQTLFIGFMAEKPFAVTVTGFHHDPRFSSEQIEFTVCSNGKKDSTSLSFYTFFPDAPLDSKFVFCVMLECEGDYYEDKYFFEPQSAFDHMDALASGAIKPRVDFSCNDRAFHVQVEKV